MGVTRGVAMEASSFSIKRLRSPDGEGLPDNTAVMADGQSLEEQPKVKRPKGKTPTGPLFTLKKWNAVAMWSWDVECDTCAICRVQVMGTCLSISSWAAAKTCLPFGDFLGTRVNICGRGVVKRAPLFFFAYDLVSDLIYIFTDACLRCQSDKKQEECIGETKLIMISCV